MSRKALSLPGPERHRYKSREAPRRKYRAPCRQTQQPLRLFPVCVATGSIGDFGDLRRVEASRDFWTRRRRSAARASRPAPASPADCWHGPADKAFHRRRSRSSTPRSRACLFRAALRGLEIIRHGDSRRLGRPPRRCVQAPDRAARPKRHFRIAGNRIAARGAGVAGIAPIGDGCPGQSNFEAGVTYAVDETSIDQARLRFRRAALLRGGGDDGRQNDQRGRAKTEFAAKNQRARKHGGSGRNFTDCSRFYLA